MANRLSMAKINAIQTLHQSGHSNRKIAKLLGVDRGSVGKFVQQFQNPPNAPPGAESHQSGPPSCCQPFQEVIEAKLGQGLSSRRIFQDLQADHGFSGSYYSVRRFVAKIQARRELPVRRMETAAGEEAQIDFGTAAPVIDGKRKASSTVVVPRRTEPLAQGLQRSRLATDERQLHCGVGERFASLWRRAQAAGD